MKTGLDLPPLSPNEIHEIKQFIRFFDRIPKKNWCVGHFIDEENNVRCAAGHLGVTVNHHTIRAVKLSKLLMPIYFLIKSMDQKTQLQLINSIDAVIIINDDIDVLGKHPKTRIINALKLRLKANENNK